MPHYPDTLLHLLLLRVAASFASLIDCSDQNFPVPSDRSCNKYLMCLRGNVVELTCPQGKVFDIYSRTCRSPSQATCSLDTALETEGKQSIRKSLPPVPEAILNLNCAPSAPKNKETTTDTLKILCKSATVKNIPDPKDCTRYYACYHGILLTRTCPDQMKFCTVKHKCLPKEIAQCVDNKVPNRTVQVPTSIPLILQTPLPQCDKLGMAMYPHPDDCRYYYRCKFGILEFWKCPLGYHFDRAELKCLPKEMAQCVDRKGPNKTGQEPSSSSLVVQTPLPGCNKVEVALYPESADCRYFYSCKFGVLEFRQCPRGYHFSRNELKCLPKEIAQCVDNKVPNRTVQVPTSIPLILQTPLPQCDKLGMAMYPHPDDCRYYYACKFGILEFWKCPLGYHFDRAELKCLPKEIAQCVDRKVPNKTGQEPSSSSLVVQTPLPGCNRVEVALYPEPADCRYFYSCKFGVLEFWQCPRGYHFSRNELKCLPKEIAQCVDNKVPNRTVQVPTSIPLILQTQLPQCDKLGMAMYPHPDDCRYYYACKFGILEFWKCPLGYHFDRAELKCLPKEMAHCVDRKVPNKTGQEPSSSSLVVQTPLPGCNRVEVALYPEPADCRYFYSCKFGVLEFRQCPRGYHFSRNELKCLPKEIAQCVDNKVLNRTVQDPTSIPLILQTPLPQCDKLGMAMYPHPDDCRYYYACKFGVLEFWKCPLGYHFDRAELKCLPKEMAQCVDRKVPNKTGQEPSSSSLVVQTPLPGCNKVEVALYPEPADCRYFYSCKFGVLEFRQCPHGYHFSRNELKCLPKEIAQCVDNKVPNRTVQVPTSIPLILQTQLPQCDKLGMAMYPHPDDCRYYYACKFGILEFWKCPLGYHFDRAELKCLPKEMAQCVDRKVPNKTGQEPSSSSLVVQTPLPGCNKVEVALYPEPADCRYFYSCKFGVLEFRQCPRGYHFSRNELKCLPKEIAQCVDNKVPNRTVQDPTSIPLILQTPLPQCDKLGMAMYPHPDDCRYYYACKFGVLEFWKCPLGYHFDRAELKCLPKEMAQCVDRKVPNKTGQEPSSSSLVVQTPLPGCNKVEVALYPEPADCRYFYSCKFGVLEFRQCPRGYHFSRNELKCLPKEIAQCVDNKVPNRTVQVPTSIPLILQTPLPQCDKLGMAMYPHPDDCRYYYACKFGILEFWKCPLGCHFDRAELKCLPKEMAQCVDRKVPNKTGQEPSSSSLVVQTPLPGCNKVEVALYPEPADCRYFYSCKFGVLEFRQCPRGYHFSRNELKCLPKEIAQCVDNKVPNRTVQDPTSIPLILQTPLPQCDKLGMAMYPHPDDCRYYYACKFGILEFWKCPLGYHFDRAELKCLPKEMAQCVDRKVPNKTGQEPSSSSLVVQTPLPGCNKVEVALYPEPADCRYFYSCKFGVLEFRQCPRGYHFSRNELKCLPKEIAQCVDNKVPNRTVQDPTSIPLILQTPLPQCDKLGMAMYPHPDDCRYYYACKFGILEFWKCPLGCHFDRAELKCLPKEMAQCVDRKVPNKTGQEPSSSSLVVQTPLPGCNKVEVALYPEPADCRYFYSCKFGVLEFRQCPRGYHFSRNELKCLPKEIAQCVDNKVPNRTVQDPTSIPLILQTPLPQCDKLGMAMYPHPDDCRYYYACKFGILEFWKCPLGYHFDRAELKCLPKEMAQCVDRKVPNKTGQEPSSSSLVVQTPLPGCNKVEVALYPEPADCRYFYSCKFGVLEFRQCPRGYHFSRNELKCLPKEIAQCVDNKVPNRTVQDPTSIPLILQTPLPQCDKLGMAMYPHPDDCRYYYACKFGVLEFWKCPLGYHFDRAELKCLPKEMAQCVDRKVPNKTGQEPSSSSLVVQTPLPGCNKVEVALYPEPADCRYFYSCKFGVLEFRQCPRGYHFSRNELKCLPKEIAQCVDNKVPNRTVQVPTSIPLILQTPLPQCDKLGMAMYPHPDDCRYYYACKFGILEFWKCPLGCHFDRAELKCLPKEIAQCVDRKVPNKTGQEPSSSSLVVQTPLPGCNKVEVALYPEPADCRYFYSCKFGVLEFRQCPRGYHFSRNELKCLPKEIAQCVDNKVPNRTVQVPTSIPLILQTPLPQCDKLGMAMYPHPDDCRYYYACKFGILEFWKCPLGYHFDRAELKCLPKEMAQCVDRKVPNKTGQEPSSSSLVVQTPLPGCNKVEVALYPEPADCRYFYSCKFGVLEFRQCPHGYHFSRNELKCLPKEIAQCVDNKVPNRTVQVPTSIPLILQTPLPQCDKLGMAMYPHPDDCRYYYACKFGILEFWKCPLGYHFDRAELKCLPKEMAQCVDRKVPNKTGQEPSSSSLVVQTPLPGCNKVEVALYPEPADCRYFYSCKFGVLEFRQCPRGYHFSRNELKCLPKEIAQCVDNKVPNRTVQVPTSIPLILQTPLPQCDKLGMAMYPHPDDCRYYYACKFGILEFWKCPLGYHFDRAELKCLPKEMAQCVDRKVPNKTGQEPSSSSLVVQTPLPGCNKVEVALYPEPADCRYFYSCKFGVLEFRQCPRGYHFSRNELKCLPKEIAQCVDNKVPNRTVQVPTSIPLILQTPLPQCDKLGMAMYPHPDDCRYYYACKFGILEFWKCPLGYHFDRAELKCLPKEMAQCVDRKVPNKTGQEPSSSSLVVQTPLPGCNKVEVALYPEPADCRYFYSCKFGVLEFRQCPHGYHFSRNELKCLPKEIAQCVDNKVPNRTVQVPTSIPLILQTPLPQCDKLGMAMYPHPDDCRYYYACKFGILEFWKCPLGYHFDRAELKCLPKEMAQCVDRKVPNKTGQEPSSSSLVVQTPLPGCNKVEVALYPEPADCRYFYSCKFGVLEFRQCPRGYHFSRNELKCLPKEIAQCVDNKVPNRTVQVPTSIPLILQTPLPQCDKLGMAMYPHPDDCRYYYACKFGILEFWKCPLGYHFDRAELKCLPKEMAQCVDRKVPNKTGQEPSSSSLVVQTPLPGCNKVEVALYPEPADCRYFYSCKFGVLEFRQCPRGYHFSRNELKCLPKEIAQCVDNKVPNRTVQVPTSIPLILQTPLPQCDKLGMAMYPHPDDCRYYYACKFGILEFWKCPLGYHFDRAELKCLPKEIAQCVDRQVPNKTGQEPSSSSLVVQTPLPGCNKVEVALYPEPADCRYFFSCKFGVLEFWQCPRGYHFSRNELKCLPKEIAQCVDNKVPNRIVQDPTSIPLILQTPLPQCDKLGMAMYPHPDDCRYYYACKFGVLEFWKCPLGYHFDRAELMCLPKETVDCNVLSAIVEPEISRNVIIAPLISPTIHVKDCGSNDVWIKPLAGNCKGFQLCHYGSLWQAQCYMGYLFDPEKLKCLPEDEISCIAVDSNTQKTAKAFITLFTSTTRKPSTLAPGSIKSIVEPQITARPDYLSTEKSVNTAATTSKIESQRKELIATENNDFVPESVIPSNLILTEQNVSTSTIPTKTTEIITILIKSTTQRTSVLPESNNIPVTLTTAVPISKTDSIVESLTTIMPDSISSEKNVTCNLGSLCTTMHPNLIEILNNSIIHKTSLAPDPSAVPITLTSPISITENVSGSSTISTESFSENKHATSTTMATVSTIKQIYTTPMKKYAPTTENYFIPLSETSIPLLNEPDSTIPPKGTDKISNWFHSPTQQKTTTTIKVNVVPVSESSSKLTLTPSEFMTVPTVSPKNISESASTITAKNITLPEYTTAPTVFHVNMSTPLYVGQTSKLTKTPVNTPVSTTAESITMPMPETSTQCIISKEIRNPVPLETLNALSKYGKTFDFNSETDNLGGSNDAIPPIVAEECGPTDLGLTPVPENCIKFSICHDGFKWQAQCSRGYLFDSEQLMCLPAHIVNCAAAYKPTSSNRTTESSNLLSGVPKTLPAMIALNSTSNLSTLLKTTAIEKITPTITVPEGTTDKENTTVSFLNSPSNDTTELPATITSGVFVSTSNTLQQNFETIESHSNDINSPSVIVTTEIAKTPKTSNSRITYITSDTDAIVTEPVQDVLDHTQFPTEDTISGIYSCSYTDESPITYLPNPENAHSYFICYYGKAFTQLCPEDHKYNVEYQICLPECKLGMLEYSTEPTNPSAYYLCDNGVFKQHFCPDNEIFDNDTLICVSTTQVESSGISPPI